MRGEEYAGNYGQRLYDFGTKEFHAKRTGRMEQLLTSVSLPPRYPPPAHAPPRRVGHTPRHARLPGAGDGLSAERTGRVQVDSKRMEGVTFLPSINRHLPKSSRSPNRKERARQNPAEEEGVFNRLYTPKKKALAA